MKTRISTFSIGAVVLAATSLGLGACASDDDQNNVNQEDDPAYDVDVGDGVDTETDEGRNVGFEDDEPSGNQTEINQP